MHTPIRNRHTPRSVLGRRLGGVRPVGTSKGNAAKGEVTRIKTCDCRGVPGEQETILMLECLECDGGVVQCTHCGKPEWWSNGKRRVALNAAEAHRWQTGHPRVVARGFGAGYEGHIVMEVGDE